MDNFNIYCNRFTFRLLISGIKVAIEEHYDFSTYITLRSYLISSIVTYITTYIVSLRFAKRINKIDMVSSLKSNE